jgi:adenine-specific DNA-methyltransferase
LTPSTRFQPELDTLRAKLNKALKQNWEEWEVPREAADGVGAHGPRPVAAGGRAPLQEWWKLRRERQAQIDASIARRAETELLYDQPYEDNKRVRVSGPFTVESLSPHRVLATDEMRPKSEADAQKASSAGQF